MRQTFVDQRKWHSQSISNGSCTLCTASIRADDHRFLVVRNMVLNVLAQKMTPVQIVNRNVKESLILRIVQVHGDDMVSTGAGQQIRNCFNISFCATAKQLFEGLPRVPAWATHCL